MHFEFVERRNRQSNGYLFLHRLLELDDNVIIESFKPHIYTRWPEKEVASKDDGIG